jgi:hypothetical protein
MKRTIYLSQNHQSDNALTLKENPHSRWNVGWLCRAHGALSFKRKGAKNTDRYLIGELALQGEDVTKRPRWEPVDRDQSTHCHGGTGYRGHIVFGSVEYALRYLKRCFNVVACAENATATQEWINSLGGNTVVPDEMPPVSKEDEATGTNREKSSRGSIVELPRSFSVGIHRQPEPKDPFLMKVGVSNPAEALRNSIRAALQRNKTYATDGQNEARSEFRSRWSRLMTDAAERYKSPINDDDEHCRIIERIASELSARFPAIVARGRLGFGTSQKAFNLYLKFLWRLGRIPEPPHCPVDGIVLRSARIAGSWTKSDSVREYMNWIKRLRAVAGISSLSDWEYELWKRSSGGSIDE